MASGGQVDGWVIPPSPLCLGQIFLFGPFFAFPQMQGEEFGENKMREKNTVVQTL